MNLDAEVFGRYRLDELLGRGGMGEVYRAYDLEFERTVAVKRLAEHLADDPRFQERFRREARHVARLRNPHIVPIHRYGEIDGQLFIDMRYVEGGDLADLIATGPVPPEQAVRILEQLASALDDAHANGLVHRDVKPSNVLLDGRVADFCYLADFGITRLATNRRSTSLTRTGALLGSLAYMAPEQFDGMVTKQSDIYALTCVFYEMLTGARPYESDALPVLMHAHMNVAAPRPSERIPAAAVFDEVVAAGMAKVATDRFASAGALAAAARAALVARAAPSSPDDEPTRPEPDLPTVAGTKVARTTADRPADADGSPTDGTPADADGKRAADGKAAAEGTTAAADGTRADGTRADGKAEGTAAEGTAAEGTAARRASAAASPAAPAASPATPAVSRAFPHGESAFSARRDPIADTASQGGEAAPPGGGAAATGRGAAGRGAAGRGAAGRGAGYDGAAREVAVDKGVASAGRGRGAASGGAARSEASGGPGRSAVASEAAAVPAQTGRGVATGEAAAGDGDAAGDARTSGGAGPGASAVEAAAPGRAARGAAADEAAAPGVDRGPGVGRGGRDTVDQETDVDALVGRTTQTLRTDARPGMARRWLRPFAVAAVILAIVGATWALAQTGRTVSGTPSAAPGPARATAAPGSAGTASAVAGPSAAPPAAAGLTEAVFTGRTSDNAITLAVGIKDGRAAGYLCDGSKVEAWLEGDVSGEDVTLHGRDPSTVLEAKASERGLFGTITVAGTDRPFAATFATGPAGLYQNKRVLNGITTRIGWIVLPDGTQVGIRNENGVRTPAPPLDPATAEAVDGGEAVRADRVTGATVVLG